MWNGHYAKQYDSYIIISWATHHKKACRFVKLKIVTSEIIKLYYWSFPLSNQKIPLLKAGPKLCSLIRFAGSWGTLFAALHVCRERERKKRRRAAGCNKRAAAAADKAHAPRRSARAAAACHIFRTVLTPVGMFGISINPRIKRARAVLVLLSCVPPLYHHAVTLLYLLICKVERKLRLPRAPALSRRRLDFRLSRRLYSPKDCINPKLHFNYARSPMYFI